MNANESKDDGLHETKNLNSLRANEDGSVVRTKQDLVHIIKTLDSANKHKKISIEEIFEILKEPPKMPWKKPPNKKLNTSKHQQPKENRTKQQSKISLNQNVRDNKRCIESIDSRSTTYSGIRKSNSIDKVRESIRGLCANKRLIPCSKQQLNPSNSSKRVSDSQKTKCSKDKIHRKTSDIKSTTEMQHHSFPQKTNRSSLSLRDIQDSRIAQKSMNSIKNRSQCIPQDSSGSVFGNKTENFHNFEEFNQIPRKIDKFQTRPMRKHSKDNNNISNTKENVLKGTSSTSSIQEETTEYLGNKPSQHSSENSPSSKKLSVFDRLKGDERDLPGIYARFVRRSKAVLSGNTNNDSKDFRRSKKTFKKSENKKCPPPENTVMRNDSEGEDYILGQLIFDKPINDKLLEMINKKPFKYDSDLFHKVNENKISAKLMAGENQKNIYLTVQKKQEQDLKTQNQESTHNRKRSSHEQMVAERDKPEQNTDREIQKTQEQSSKLKKVPESHPKQKKIKDPMKENLNMSPTTAITMMVLAADKQIAKKSEVFGDIERKPLKVASKIKTQNQQ